MFVFCIEYQVAYYLRKKNLLSSVTNWNRFYSYICRTKKLIAINFIGKICYHITQHSHRIILWILWEVFTNGQNNISHLLSNTKLRYENISEMYERVEIKLNSLSSQIIKNCWQISKATAALYQMKFRYRIKK